MELDALELLRGGLPESAAPRRRIVVVGAGMAGLTTAMLLKDAGHDVVVLEGQNRLGGRILTHRGFAGDMYGEFGAMRFPEQHPLVQWLIRDRFGLETRPFPMYDEDTFVFLQGKGVRRRDFDASAFTFDLSAREAERTPHDLLRQTVQPLVDVVEGEEPGKAWQRLLADYDKYTLLGYLKERGLGDGALAMLGPLFNLESRYHFSLVEWFSHYYEDVFGHLVYIVDGADALPRAFEPQLMDDIRLGAQVHAVEQDDRHVRVHFRTGRRSQVVTADECVITVPFASLRHMEIEGLDPDKWYAIRNTYYGRAHKLFMQFSERWWESAYGITHGLTVTDLAIRNIVYPPAGQDTRFRKGVMIASYCWEQDSMPYTPLAAEESIAQALEDLVKIHPEARDTFEFGVYKDWALDWFACGIGPLFRPFEMSEAFYDDVIRPVNRVWFANDACDRRHRRWVEGALKAAVKNAYAIHSGVRDHMPWRD
ncbi:flavin monoamine oxidase family protein [Saccharothrix obliqua]|uniref:flavin monoamine oxidase family protein n=1 Tax=Saccharothrix obliqua TaxID=2861747 RepID=UPI001C5E629C|nr:FAD-dependent oxidoreductase [Saccharothrix obliqua]MBW4721973.1 FAD-dependent oxidoreductase [Saccharothrix obliqua]